MTTSSSSSMTSPSSPFPVISSSSSLDVDKLQAPMFAAHETLENRTYEWRVRQLKLLQRMMVEQRDVFQSAIVSDLGRDPTEALVVELVPCETEIVYIMNHLREWMTPQHVATPAALFPCQATVESVPLHAPGVLVIGPSNYPLHLVVRPLAGILAGGNPAVVKPSELTPRTALALAEVIPQYFDSGAVQVVLGAVAETTALLEKPWSKVLFTGSTRVGKIVAQACAATFTPCVLELGGKSPTVVDESVPASQLSNVADRIVFAKCLNAGQTCVAPDTLLVHESHLAGLTAALQECLIRQFGVNPQLDGELPRIVTTSNTKRLVEMLQEIENSSSSLSTKILVGGSKQCDVEDRYVAPTLVLNPSPSSRMMQEEIFGPILPILTYCTRQEAIKKIQQLGPGIPLFLYVFCTTDRVFRTYTERCRAGGAVRNDAVVQLSNYEQPLGGVGTSGQGEWYGKYSFQTFTDRYPVTSRPLGAIWDFNNLRCHPYKGWKGKVLGKLLYLPVIPAMPPSRLWLLGSALTVAILVQGEGVGIPSMRYIKNAFAAILESMAATLRK